jgi:hypothetical protein
MERERDAERVHVPGSPTRCPFCKGEIEDLKQVVACAACGARHHGACHQENGRCATCGSEDVLVPRAAPVALARVKREEPPRGSFITVEREGDALVYTWPVRDTATLTVAIILTLMVLTAVVGIPLLYAYFTAKRARFRVGPGEIEFDARAAAGGGFARKIRARREDVGAIRVQANQGGAFLTIDVGMDRWIVKTGMMQSALRPPELEWLAQALEAWKNEA